MSKLFRVDVQIAGTAYVKAKSQREAEEKLKVQLTQATLMVADDAESDVPISGLRFDDPDLPDVSLSPAMTIHGIYPGQTLEEAD
jgi:hypothetical protein